MKRITMSHFPHWETDQAGKLRLPALMHLNLAFAAIVRAPVTGTARRL